MLGEQKSRLEREVLWISCTFSPLYYAVKLFWSLHYETFHSLVLKLLSYNHNKIILTIKLLITWQCSLGILI